jgi:uncharacterized surface protein with fasciclin (FAS1) repeats
MNRKSVFAGIAATAVLALGLGGAPQAQAAGPKGPTLVDVAIDVNSDGPFAGAFDTLIAAVLAADPIILATLTGNGQKTVFAPTDEAFAALGLNPGNVGDLPKEFLTAVLAYHVANGRRDSGDVVGAERVRMLAGGFLYKEEGSTVLVDNLGREANIIVTDVPAANGIIHAIDAVVLPYAP